MGVWECPVYISNIASLPEHDMKITKWSCSGKNYGHWSGQGFAEPCPGQGDKGAGQGGLGGHGRPKDRDAHVFHDDSP